MTYAISRRVSRALAVPAAAAVLFGTAVTTGGILGASHVAAATCATLAESSTQFTTTGESCFTVPAGVHSIHAVLIGGSGGKGFKGLTFGTAGLGGDGAQVTADVAVSPGQKVYVEVGGSGADGSGSTCTLTAARRPSVILQSVVTGGFNGGAHGGTTECASVGGQGGGETDLRWTPSADLTATCPDGSQYASGATSLSSRILVAGGGGGGGNPAVENASGGNGGTAGAGTTAAQTGGTGGASGGTGGGPGGSSAGGAGGVAGTGFGGNAGHPGSGSQPQPCGGGGASPEDSNNSGGGGGGGYFGGGGGGSGGFSQAQQTPSTGGGGGGGAGSSFADPAFTSNVSIVPDAPNPSATISFTLATPTPTPTSSVQAITTPSVGAGGQGVDLGVGILVAGVSVLGALAFGWRRSRRDDEPTPPA